MSTKNNNLPIGLDTETILKKWMKLIETIPKAYRYTIIPEILKTLSYMISDIFFANAIKEERKYHLTNYIARLLSIKSCKQGVKFTGYIIKPWGIYTGNRIINNAFHVFSLDRPIDNMLPRYNSYMGIFNSL